MKPTSACTAPDNEVLLVDWLNALVYEMATRHMLFSRFEVAIENHRLRASPGESQSWRHATSRPPRSRAHRSANWRCGGGRTTAGWRSVSWSCEAKMNLKRLKQRSDFEWEVPKSGAMRAGINCALANRQILTHLTRAAFAEVFPGAQLPLLYDVSHNTCKEDIPSTANGAGMAAR